MLMAQLKHSVAHDKASLLHTNRQLQKNLKHHTCALFAYYKLYDAVSTAQIICHRLQHGRNIKNCSEGRTLTLPL
jgi:hypothetical protein